MQTYCPNCGRERLHDHSHGPEDGRSSCTVTCRVCEAEMEVETEPDGPPAHMVGESVRWSQADR